MASVALLAGCGSSSKNASASAPTSSAGGSGAASSGTSTSSTEWTTDPNFFPVADTQGSTLVATANGAKLLGKTNIGLAYCAELPGCKSDPYFGSIAKALSMSYTGGLPISGTASGYTSECLGYKSKGAQSVFLAVAAATAERVIAACKTAGLSTLFIDNPQNWSHDQVTNPVWSNVLFSADAPLWFGTGPGTAEFLAAMAKYEPKSVLDSSATSGWIGAEVFGKAAEAGIKAGVTPTSQEVFDGLDGFGPDFDLGGVIPKVTYTAGKPAVQNESCGWYMEAVNGQETAPKGYDKICLPNS